MRNILTAISIVIVAVMGASIAASAQHKVIYHTIDKSIVRGINALNAGQMELARDHFAKAVTHNLNKQVKGDVLSNLCSIELKLGNYAAAKTSCIGAVNIKRHDWRRHVNLGHALRELGELDKAENHYSRALKLNDKAIIAQKSLASLKIERSLQVASVQ